MPKKLSEEDVKLLADFAKRLRRLRKERELTQDELEHQAKVHDNMIGRLERGERIPNFLQLIKISDALEVEISAFFSDQSEESE